MLILQWRHQPAQVIRLNPHIAVTDDQVLVASLLHHSRKSRDLIVGSRPSGSNQNTDLRLGKIVPQPPEHRQSRIIGVYTKQNFVVRIVLPAKACEILIGLWVKAKHRLHIADGGQKISRAALARPEKPETAKDRDAIVNKRDRRYRQECCSDYGKGQQGNTLNQLTT